jgi:hypothetical protein
MRTETIPLDKPKVYVMIGISYSGQFRVVNTYTNEEKARKETTIYRMKPDVAYAYFISTDLN